MSERIETMVVQTMEAFGYLGIVVLMFLENVFPPIPSELIMPLAGFTASQGELSLSGVIVAGIAGSILGALPFYAVGRFVGAERIRGWVERWGKWFLVKPADFDLATAWFNRYSNATVLFCRLIPAVRSVISAPAGVVKMNFAVFLAYSTIGMTAWTAILGYVGYALGENWHRVTEFVDPGSKIVVAICGVAALVFVGVRVARRGKRAE